MAVSVGPNPFFIGIAGWIVLATGLSFSALWYYYFLERAG